MVEQRECHQEYCLPECPLYRLKELKKQENDNTKLVATFIVDKVVYPIGELQYQTMRLEQKNTIKDSLWKMQKSNQFDKQTKKTLFVIGNLLVDATYFPIYEFHLTMNSIGLKELTKIAWECKGKVCDQNYFVVQVVNYHSFSISALL